MKKVIKSVIKKEPSTVKKEIKKEPMKKEITKINVKKELPIVQQQEVVVPGKKKKEKEVNKSSKAGSNKNKTSTIKSTVSTTKRLKQEKICGEYKKRSVRSRHVKLAHYKVKKEQKQILETKKTKGKGHKNVGREKMERRK